VNGESARVWRRRRRRRRLGVTLNNNNNNHHHNNTHTAIAATVFGVGSDVG